MPVPIDQVYSDYINVLLERLAKEDREVAYKEGRKFDKIYVDGGVRFFINRANGTIYGAKSALAPNFDWWFGTIYESEKWDWSDYHPAPAVEGYAILRKTYGSYRHYIPVPVTNHAPVES